MSRHRVAVVAALVGTALILSGCSAASARSSGQPSPAAATATRGSGPVNVLYAGSLVELVESQLGPAFHAATGYTVQGFSGGSTALATQIKGKVHEGDVFISAAPAVNASLEGPANGDWVSWYATFAASPLVIGYNPKSSFASELKTNPWYDVVGRPGFKLGSTDPATDPKGKLAKQALTAAAAQHHDPALAKLATSNPNIGVEQSLVGRLQSGQLDAAFFYASEAKAAGIPTVPLTGQSLKAVYTITELKGAPNAAGAAAFIEYLLGPAGQRILTKDGYTLTLPAAVNGTGVPTALAKTLGQ